MTEVLQFLQAYGGPYLAGSLVTLFITVVLAGTDDVDYKGIFFVLLLWPIALVMLAGVVVRAILVE